MSVNESIDPRFLYHVEDESLRFRVGESAPKIRELETVGDRRFRIRQGFCGNRVEKDETRYSDGDDDEDNVSFRRHGALIHHPSNNGDSDSAAAETNKESKNPGSVGWELVVREDEERKASMIDRHEMEFKVMITNPDDNVSHSHHNTLSKRDFASLEKERVTSVSSSWESLKAILSDPVTGTLMNDATILPCGHSFGAGGLKEVKRMKACFTCSQPTSEGSGKPNLCEFLRHCWFSVEDSKSLQESLLFPDPVLCACSALRIVVHAFCQEEESDYIHSLKRRKDKSDQQKRSFCIPKITETPKSSRGIQFPFSIGDLIIIEGNKRTPPRFVGRRAVIMTQCLNGWYVVKTVDNAESIKLQHCSLAKISDNSPAKVTVAEMAPSWL